MSIEADRVAGLKGADGLAAKKEGFCFEAHHDALFALGWPHIRLLTEVDVEPYKTALYHLKQTDFDLRLRWPRSLALALVRAWGIGRLYDVAPGRREIRDEVKEALWDLKPMSNEEVREHIQVRLENTPFWIGDRATESFVLLAEALTDAVTVASAIVDGLENFSFAQFADMQPMASVITYQLGYLLLRMPPKEARAFEERIDDLIAGTAGQMDRPPSHPCHARSLMLVRNGAKAAHLTTDRDLKWYTHAEDPVAIRMRAAVNRGFTMPDARLMWIGGPGILDTRFGGWYNKLDSTDQRWFVEQIAPIKAPEIVPLMIDLEAQSTVRPLARSWLTDHREYAMPIIERLAGVNNAHAEAARRFLEENAD